MLLRRYAGKLRRQAVKLYDRSINLAPRSEEPYATHVPVLVGIAAAFKPNVLVEFGSGMFSTLSFLDRIAFPSLKAVRSYENNQQWFDQMRQRLPSNAGVDLEFVEGQMYRAVDRATTSAAAMIFIDDSVSAEERAHTVQEVARRCGPEPLVVMHDHDLLKLRLATHKFEHRIAFETYNPQTSVMWHGHPERRPVVEEVVRIIRQNATNILLSDVRAWTEVFSREFAIPQQ
jgi:hypothetical protein